jgi:hypothetical protein
MRNLRRLGGASATTLPWPAISVATFTAKSVSRSWFTVTG